MGQYLQIVVVVLLMSFLTFPTFADASRVGERSNRSFKSQYGGFIATWDGRVVLFPNHIKDSLYKWDAYVLRYENIQVNEKGEPNLQDPKVFSPLVTFDGDFEIGSSLNVLGAQNRMHLAIAPDPAFTQNPFPSDEKGNPVQDLNSQYQTYRLFIVGQVGKLKSYTPNRVVPGLFAQSTGEIIVKNLRSASAEIVSARVLSEGKPIRASSNAEPFFGFEPTLSNDGRLLLWGGHPKNGGIHFIMYSFNPTPKNNLTWSTPRHLTEMYSVHGAGAKNETLVEGLKFSERYPIAKKPLRDAYGKYLDPKSGYPGAYPWLSLDNGDLFCSTVSTFFAARRSGFSVIGSLTSYASRNIDGAVNIARANVTGRADVWDSTDEGKDLLEKYNALTDESGKPFGFNAFQRIMISPLMQIPSMWTPFVASNSQQVLPFVQHKNTFGLLMSHSDRYVEVSLPESEDGHFILNLPMNEAIIFDPKYLGLVAETSEVRDWSHVHNMAKYDPISTPDLSGLFQTGRLLNGAQFPFEYHQAEKKWQQSRQLVDRMVGVEGNSIYFKPKSYVLLEKQSEALKKVQAQQEINISFFLRPYQELKSSALLLWEKFLYVAVEQNSLVVKNFQNQKWLVLARFPILLKNNQWQHLSLNLSKSEISFYLKGDPVTTVAVALTIPMVAKNLWLGPSSSDVNSSLALYSMDQVSISAIRRSLKELRSIALWKNESTVKPQAGGAAMVNLGEKLFNEILLSRDKTISCSSCHIPEKAFADGRKLAIGIGNQLGSRNTPSLFGVGKMSSLMWDGRAQSLEEQALLPIQNSKEMALDIPEALKRLKEKYSVEFEAVFHQQPNRENLGQALAAFQRSIQVPKTALDLNILSEQQLQGRGLFNGKARCVGCHSGEFMMDQSFHNVGLDLSAGVDQDLGRMQVTGRTTDRLKFKTPSLRAVKFTAPYFHDGRFQTLEEVIDFYNRGGDTMENRDSAIRALGLSAEERAALKSFLEAF